MKKFLASVTVVAVLFAAGCEATKKVTDSLGLGSSSNATTLATQALSGSSKSVAYASSALVVGWAGNKIYEAMNEQDKTVLADSTRQTATTGQARQSRNAETGVEVRTRVAGTQRASRSVPVPVLKDRIETVPPLDLIGEMYTVNAATEVRGGPGTDYKPSGSLASGQLVQVVGQVQGQPWYMVAENGAGSGFVPVAALAKAAEGTPVPPAPATGGNVGVTEVQAKQEVRTVEQTVQLADGSKHTETVKVKQGPNGWEIE